MRLPGIDRGDGFARKRRSATDPDPGVVLLIVTCDIELYTKIADIASAWDWIVQREAEPPALPGSDAPAIIVLDGDLTDGKWKEALVSFKAGGRTPCVLLASRVFDSYLQEEVARYGGFDVITRSQSREQLMDVLRFAWFRKTKL